MAVTDTTAGFRYQGRMGSTKEDVERNYTVADTDFARGDLVNLESGEIDLAATGDTALVGVVAERLEGGTASTSKIKVYAARDAYFAVYDANARSAGDTLDITGATGAMSVGAPTNNDLVVIADSAADELTFVTFNGNHYLG